MVRGIDDCDSLYDEADPKSIELYAKGMIGKTFREIVDADDRVQEKSGYPEASRRSKGSLGTLIELHYFHYMPNDDPRPDFYKAGLELKVTPFIHKKSGYRAKERLVIDMINYIDVINESFESSRFWNKAKKILLVYYLYQKELSRLDYKIRYVQIFTPPVKDIAVIRQDFEKIVDKIRAGRAHELSEGDTDYLGACTKGAKATDTRQQPNSEVPAKPRAFCFKVSYMTYVLNNYIIPGGKHEESISDIDPETPFEDIVLEKISRYRGKTQDELCSEFGIDNSKNPKNIGAMIVYRILGIKGNSAEEFEKAGIVIKTIRVSKNNTINESMSFPTFHFKQLSKETWEDSTLGNYLRETRFLFVVFHYDDQDRLLLRGCQFWNMPYDDLERHVHKVWDKTIQVLNSGCDVKRDTRGNYISIFPKKSEDAVCHVRPHGKNSADTDVLPNGQSYPKQCFWLRNSYILSQLKDDLVQ